MILEGCRDGVWYGRVVCYATYLVVNIERKQQFMDIRLFRPCFVIVAMKNPHVC